MLKKLSLIGATLAMGTTAAVVPATPAFAGDGYSRYYDDDRYEGRRYYRGDRRYANRGYRNYRGNDYSYRCRRRGGTTGAIIGAVAGGLLGREIAGRGDRGTGTILGAGAGALLGREVERSSKSRRC